LGESNEISEMICDLSQLLRLSIGSREPLISLGEEVEHARMYMKIQMRRFPNRFRVDWEIPESLMAHTVVQLTLHPLLENAILHGVKRMAGFGVIRVSGEVQDGVLSICVSDNGPGLTQEALDRIETRRAEGVFRTSEHVGLYNVDQRLRLLFGDAYGVTIRSTPYVETCITMRLPVCDGRS
jgi:two-component system sensor histidine kinase YesM